MERICSWTLKGNKFFHKSKFFPARVDLYSKVISSMGKQEVTKVVSLHKKTWKCTAKCFFSLDAS